MCQRQQGFTLVEMLLAMTLVSMILALAYSGLTTSTRAVDRGEALVDRSNHLRIVHGFVRQQLSSLMPLQIPPADEIEDQPVVYFEGDDRWVHFAAVMPGHLSSGGPHEQTLFFERGSNGIELKFDHDILRRDEDWPTDSEREPIVLIDGIRRGSFAYLTVDEEGFPDRWVDEWEDPQTLPLMIRVEIELDPAMRLVWPTMDIRPILEGAIERPSFERPFVLPGGRNSGG